MTITKSSKDNGERVARLELSMPELAILTTMVGYACAAANIRGHVEALRMFAGFGKKLLRASGKEDMDGKDRSRTKTESN